MKHTFKALGAFALTLAMTLLLAAGPACTAVLADEAPDSVTGYLLILCDPPASLFSMDPIEQATLFAASEEREELLLLSEDLNIYRASSLEDIQSLVYSGQVQVVEPDYQAELFDMVADPTQPNDPYFTNSAPYQFGLKDEHGIRVRAAWDAGLTGEGVTIAIIDSGINPEHIDTPVNIARGRYFYFRENPALANAGGTQLTVNGVTKWYGYYSTDYVVDNNGHGTMVSGIIAADTDNGQGIAGIAPKATIIPIRCFTKTEGHLGGLTSNLISGIDYAVKNGADIINMSWGVRSNSETLRAAIDRADQAGCILIAAVGNDGATSLQYPAAWENVIGVGSTDRDGYLSGFSQRNDSVDVCAPGGASSGRQIYSLSYSSNTALASSDGTSFSAPVVSAVAALLKEANPTMTQADFLSLLDGNCDPVLLQAGDDPTHAGRGLLNVQKLLDASGYAGILSRKEADGSVTVRAAYHPVQSQAAPADSNAILLIGAYNEAGHLLDSLIQSVDLGATYGAYSLNATFQPTVYDDIASVQAFYLKKDASLSALAPASVAPIS